MIAVRPGFALSLAIHPNSHGFGWIAVEGAFTPYNWGTVRVRKGEPKNHTCLARAERLINRLNPTTLILEAASAAASKRSPRIRRLSEALADTAATRGVRVALYAYEDVRAIFAVVGARSRYEIAEAVVRHYPILHARLPKRRRPWETENEALAIFSAAALAITHERLDAEGLLDALM